jgi:endonuclease/exonuclease/phosphatase family protein
MQLQIGWWNTSWAPRKRKSSDSAVGSIAISVINDLLSSGLDILGLGEVSDSEIRLLEKEFGQKGYGLISAQNSAGRSSFDMALIYRIEQVSCVALPPWITAFGKQKFKICVPIKVSTHDSIFFVMLVHWPSRMFCPRGSIEREKFASDMRSSLDDFIGSAGHDVIVMGDFNDEPHDRNICETLLALRDIDCARRELLSLYNPFWNHVGSFPLHSAGNRNLSRCGTYWYRKNHLEEWWTFDQIMFSSSFLGSGAWEFDESATGVYETSELLWLVRSKQVFDHLPVVSLISRTTA